MKKSYISLAMLPLEDMEEYLSKVIGYKKKEDASDDTKKVATVDSKKIAVAATNPETGELMSDRETVKNALMLGGIASDQYLTMKDSDTLLTDTYTVSDTMSNEIKALRDELYQMRGELVKNGLVNDTNYYGGFQDPFREGKEKYISKEITKLAQTDSRVVINDITVLDGKEFEAGEYIVVKTLKNSQVVKVTNKLTEDRLQVEPALSGPLDEFTGIYKTLGSYKSGEFVFGEKTGTLVSPDIRQMILKDGKEKPKSIYPITRPNSGFATTMPIPRSMGGVIRSIDVSLACTGNPGSITAYIYKENAAGVKELVGKSIAVDSSYATMSARDITLKFDEQIILEAGRDYILALKTTWADDNNKWHVCGFDEICVGEIHKDCFTVIDNSFEHFTEDSDMYLSLAVSEILEDQIEYFQEGIYSCLTEMPTNMKATRVRVELKVNREGRFKVVENPNTLVPGGLNGNLQIENEDGKSYGSINVFPINGTIAIGNQIAKIGSEKNSNLSFSLEKQTYAPGLAPVYRIGYKVVVKARCKTIDYTNSKTPIKYTNTTVVELPLVAIIDGKENGKEDFSTDRLIFEKEIKLQDNSNVLLGFNEIEAQVVWDNKGIAKEEIQANKELAGKILDITMSTDQAYNKITK